MKTCTKCGEEKQATPEYFYRDKSKKDGLAPTCKECKKEYMNNHYKENKGYIKKYREKNREEKREYDRRYYEENREKKSEYYKKRYQENREKKCEYSRKHYHENKEMYRKYSIIYHLENPEVNRLQLQRRRARMAQLPHTLTLEEWYETLEYFNNECAYCGDSECNLEQEHVIPVVKGGGYTQENIIPACGTCNSSKNARDLEEWYVSYRHYDEERLNKILDYVEVIKGSVILRVRSKK